MNKSGSVQFFSAVFIAKVIFSKIQSIENYTSKMNRHLTKRQKKKNKKLPNLKYTRNYYKNKCSYKQKILN